PAGSRTAARAPTARVGSAPASRATASASMAFSIWWNPTTGSVTECPRQVMRGRLSSSSSAASGRTCAPAPLLARELGWVGPDYGHARSLDQRDLLLHHPGK